jgi:hypothetical protein
MVCFNQTKKGMGSSARLYFLFIKDLLTSKNLQKLSLISISTLDDL